MGEEKSEESKRNWS